MKILIILILPLFFTLYSVFSKDSSGKFAAFIVGLIAGLISLIIALFIPLPNEIASAEFWKHVSRFFFDYFFLHTILGLLVFFLISFSISEETLKASFSAVFGIFSVIFGNIVYKLINEPIITEQILFLLIITGSILICDFAFNILISKLTIASDLIVYIISIIPFLLLCFLGSTALASFYLATTSNYFIAPLGIFITGIILNVILSKIG